MPKGIITFDFLLKEEILDLFDKCVDPQGYIVEKSDLTQKALTPAGEEIEKDEFAGIAKGSIIFIKSDIISLMKLSEKLSFE